MGTTRGHTFPVEHSRGARTHSAPLALNRGKHQLVSLRARLGVWEARSWCHQCNTLLAGPRARVRARLPPKNGFDTPPKYVFSPFSLYLQCILSAIHPLYLRHSDVLYRCVFSRYVVRYRSGIGLHAWCLHVLSIQYMRLYRRFSILNDTHRYMTSLSPLPRGCCACVSIQEAPSCPLV